MRHPDPDLSPARRDKKEPWPHLPPQALTTGVPLGVVLHQGVRGALYRSLAHGFSLPVRAALAGDGALPVCWTASRVGGPAVSTSILAGAYQRSAQRTPAASDGERMTTAMELMRSWLDSRWFRYAIGVTRSAFAVVLVTQVAVGLWHLALPGDLPSLVSDLRAGKVRVLEIGEAPGPRAVGEVAAEPHVRWRTTDGTWHAYSLHDPPPPGSPRLTILESGAGRLPEEGQRVIDLMTNEADDAEARTVAWAYQSHHRTTAVRSTTDNPLQWWLDIGDGGIVLVSLLVLVAGPRTGRATKWAWFWLLSIPLHVGLLAYLAMEAPWTRPRPTDRRFSGLTAFAVAIVSTYAIAMSSVGLELL